MSAPAARAHSAGVRRRLRPRRGATLAFVCVTITVMLGGAAFAVDLGQLHAAGAEAQAAADAAALAGARFMQQYPYYYSDGNLTSSYGIGPVTSASRIAGGPVRLASYGLITYDPASGVITPVSSWDQAAGMQVAVSGTPRYVFAGALGLTPPTVTRQAAAWIANMNGATCVRPLALPYTRNYEVGIVGHRSQDSSITRLGQVAPDYTYRLVSSLQPIYPHFNKPIGRTYTAIPQWEREVDAQPVGGSSGREVTGRWMPVDFSGGVGDVYNAFKAYVSTPPKSTACQAASAQVGTDEVPIPGFDRQPNGQRTRLLQAADDGFSALCRRPSAAVDPGNTDAHCYSDDGTVGVRVRVMLADSLAGASGGGTFRVNTREVTMVRVMCYFRQQSDVCNPATIKDETSPNAPSSYWQMYATGPTGFTGYPRGTITYVLDGPTNFDMTSDVVLGTKPGITQRVLLVK